MLCILYRIALRMKVSKKIDELSVCNNLSLYLL